MSIWKPIKSFPNDGRFCVARNKEKKLEFLNMPDGCILGKWEKYKGKWCGSHCSAFKAIEWTEIPTILLSEGIDEIPQNKRPPIPLEEIERVVKKVIGEMKKKKTANV